MQVQAVSPVLNKGYSSVNFEGKKKDTNSSHPISSSLKAVPLAVLVALSPLNTTNAENIMRSQRNDNVIELAQVPKDIEILDRNNVLEYKDFKGEEGEVRVNLVKYDGNSNDKRIWIDYDAYDDASGVIGILGYVSNFNHVSYDIVGDDGVTAGTLKFNQAFVEDAEGRPNKCDGIGNPEACKYVGELLAKNKTNVSVNNINLSLIPNSRGALQPFDIDKSWIEEAKTKGQPWGSAVKAWEVDTSDGKYTVTIFTMDNDENNFEKISIQKENGPRMQVDNIISGNAEFNARDKKLKNIDLYQINISQKYVGSFCVYNKELWNFLFQLYNVKENNGAFGGTNGNFGYTIDRAGKTVPYINET